MDFGLDFYCLCSLQKSISKLIFAGYTGSKNPVRNRLKIKYRSTGGENGGVRCVHNTVKINSFTTTY